MCAPRPGFVAREEMQAAGPGPALMEMLVLLEGVLDCTFEHGHNPRIK